MEDDTINVSRSLSVVSSLFRFHSFTYPNIVCLHILPRVLVSPCRDSPAHPPLSDPVSVIITPWQNISHSRCLPLDRQTYIAPCRRFLSVPPESIPSLALCALSPPFGRLSQTLHFLTRAQFQVNSSLLLNRHLCRSVRIG